MQETRFKAGDVVRNRWDVSEILCIMDEPESGELWYITRPNSGGLMARMASVIDSTYELKNPKRGVYHMKYEPDERADIVAAHEAEEGEEYVTLHIFAKEGGDYYDTMRVSFFNTVWEKG